MSERVLLTLADVTWPVRTERLLLRPATVADLKVVWSQWRRREDVAQFMTNPTRELDAYLERLGPPEKLATVLVVELHDRSAPEGRLIMDLHVRVLDSYAQTDVEEGARGTRANLGWSMDPTVHGRGLETEALRAALGICFDVLGLHRVEADCFAANEPSWRLMERVGMTRESHQRADALHRELGWVDRYAYAMLDSDWEAVPHA
ncbi:hypothetical protein N802_06225 [Knoellia sinensis KCTC 19936]|uniref:N-acetyltransferase domain-containing protein n=1 Tax=Knoellia sinensis KCTC 19936 TaxID=1385520 RepID=A0A0A0J3U5_9MICO|nr:GNAT family protein [Knoellia sinensis]KGN30802.1 hypothetical protein N802_06225 [Knoellia sinensis KCTC 19936]